MDIPDTHIIHDYNLTTYGLAPALPALIARFQREALYRDKMVGVQNMGSARKETMEATLRRFRQKYGDVESYLLNSGADENEEEALTKEDLEILRRNLRLSLSEKVSMTPTESESSTDSTISSTWASENEGKAEMTHRNAWLTDRIDSKSAMGSWGYYVLLWLGCLMGIAATGWVYVR